MMNDVVEVSCKIQKLRKVENRREISLHTLTIKLEVFFLFFLP